MLISSIKYMTLHSLIAWCIFYETFLNTGIYLLVIRDKTYCINLELILSAPHFNFKGKYKNELNSIAKEIIEKCNHNPTLNLTIPLSEYINNISELYEAFWCCISFYIASLSEKVTNLLYRYPNNFLDIPNHLERLFIIEFQPQLELLSLKSLTDSPYVEYHTEALDFLKKSSDLNKHLSNSILSKAYFI